MHFIAKDVQSFNFTMQNYGQYPTKQLLSFFWAAQTGHYAIENFCLFGMLSFFRIFYQIFIEMCFQFKKKTKNVAIFH